MSTLVPGSEAWKIAEPLEYASDIWNALEEKYGPKDGTNNMWPLGTPSVENKVVVEAAKILDPKNKATDFGQNPQPVNVVASGSGTGASAGEGRPQTLSDRDASPAETEIDRGRRDKRFLWALLNGGKEKLDAVTIQTGQQLCGL
jgi:hypothetical protein